MNKREIMTAAWALFRETYHYPAVPFKSLGRQCFGWCLSETYRRAKEAARIAAIPNDVKAERIAKLKWQLELTPYIESYLQSTGRARALRAEINALTA